MTAQATMEAKISKIAGAAVELTIRGAKSFTFSLASRNDTAAELVAEFFRPGATVSVEHDDECGSFIYVDA